MGNLDFQEKNQAEFTDLEVGKRLSGVVADGDVTVVALDVHATGSATLTYRSASGQLGERIISRDDLVLIQEASKQRWAFDADGAAFRLASEARRIQSAHLADPYAAVDTSNIEPYPHQIDAVYRRFLEKRPLKFLLADDPGAGKTIMSGLLIRELMLRGDVARCLVVAPGSLVEQWQEELWDKFGLSFELMSRSAVEASRTGNPFLEKNLLVARVDQLSRSEDLIEKLKLADWDLVIVDEAHKMSAHLYGDELRKTKRFELGEVLRDRTRHFLLLSATPHNGKNEDFLAFMTLIDPERFAGRLRDNELPETDDVMRRLVKEHLTTFEGRRLFPQRFAHSANFELSEPEHELYEAVSDYVRSGMDRASRMQEEGDRRRGIIFGFALAALQRRLASSPAAIYHSLRRRRDRLGEQASELRRLAAGGSPVPVTDLPRGVRFSDLEDFDFDNFDDVELEELEDHVIDASTAAATAEEIEAEVAELKGLVKLADVVRTSGEDTKWIQLRGLLRSEQFRTGKGEALYGDDVPSGPRKLIVFSEHKDTLDYVAERIRAELGRPEDVEVIHGGIKRHDRRVIQDRFRVDPRVRVLVATDAASEGVNLQVANMMVNYDLPWNPNRIEQRFGRIHRIGQQRSCHLWNMVAHKTREGVVFTRLFEKIEQQRGVYGDQVYDVLGDSHINTSLQELLFKAITADDDPAHLQYMQEVIEGDIGKQMVDVLEKRALVEGLADPAANNKIREDMERARTRKLQPWFVLAFFSEALRQYGGRIISRESGRYEITRVPAVIRSYADPNLGTVHDRYDRVTCDKTYIQVEGGDRAELISPGTPLLSAVINKVLADHGDTLSRGATLVDSQDYSTNLRLLVYLDHVITDGRQVHGNRQVVSQRFQYVEIDQYGHAKDAGNEPYIGYDSLKDEDRALLEGSLDMDWVDHTAEETAKNWAIEHLSQPHFEEIRRVTEARVAKVQEAVRERLGAEIHYWDQRTEELKKQELAGQKPRLNSGRARARADELEARLIRRRLDLDRESDLHNSPPNIVGAAIIVPQGLIDWLRGVVPDLEATTDKMETDRRAVAAVLETERALGRNPEAQSHSNPGYDILSIDPNTGTHYFIEVKGHLPRTTEIHISAQQISKAKSLPEHWRLAIVSVPDDPDESLTVRYLIDPFSTHIPHFAQTSLALNVVNLLKKAQDPC
ncbi:MAG: DUF3883 domain-containing protein [Acidimicrobiia bacterium]|nr:DUF3883 domain-containing protein [Acidimicrobiia bacterium]MYC57382.1 DUF3883 domain-containing protein [Acidimicrobiia bacterium]MYI31132.1 DUF3883 domain-containing protein [Acidimicrobiia bacterium]